MPRIAASFATVAAGVTIPNITLNDGIGFPMISLGTWQQTDDVAENSVMVGLQEGFNHIDTANNYHNQAGVGKALAKFDRSSYYLLTKVPNVNSDAYEGTKKLLEEDLTLLGLDYVDMMLVHAPASTCKAIQDQWRAIEEFQAAGKAKSIGVSNFCQSSFDCLKQTWKVVPAINQVQVHVGMGTDPTGIISYGKSFGVVTQAYSPLGDGTKELITGDLVSNIGKAHSKTGAQVSLRWLIENGIPLSTKTTRQSHMSADLDIFSFSHSDDEKKALNGATSPAGNPSWACSKSEIFV